MDRRPTRLVLLAALVPALAGAAHAQSPDRPPTTPADPVATVYSPTFAALSWQRSSDDRGAVVGYEVLRDEVSLGTFDALSYVDRDLRPGRGYDYVIRAIDNAGQKSPRATVRAVTPDARPEQPTGVRAEVYSRTATELFWERSPVFGRRYEIRRDGEVVAVTDGTSYFDDTLTDTRAYLFEVISLNRQDKRSASVRIFVDTGDRGPMSPGPAAPTGQRAAVYSRTAAEVFWDRPDTFGLRYDVIRNGERLTRTDGTSWFDDGLAGGTSYTYEIVAIDPEGRRSAPASVMLSTPGDAAPPVREGSVISVDNHVELLGHVFDIYTGNAYGPTVRDLPDYAGTPEEPPFGPDPVPHPFVVTETCDNGGTARFELIRWGDFAVTGGWVFDFDDCQSGADVFDGVLSNATGTRRFVSSPGFTLDTPSGGVRFRGNVEQNFRGLPGANDSRWWRTDPESSYFSPNAYDPSVTGIDFVRTDPDGNVTFELLEASTNFGHTKPLERYLSGGFSVRSDATDGERLQVTVLEELHHDGNAFSTEHMEYSEHFDFDTGVLQLSAGNGDTLVLDAATGEHATVRIEITVDGVTETLTQPWSLWREQLDFSDEFLGE